MHGPSSFTRDHRTLPYNRPGKTKNQTNIRLKPYDHRIYCVNIDLRHQYGVAESQTFLLAKWRRRAKRNGCFRRLAKYEQIPNQKNNVINNLNIKIKKATNILSSLKLLRREFT